MRPVKNQPDLVKDPRSGAVININKREMELARHRKKVRANEKERVNKIESELIEIKNLLEKLIGKTDG